MEEVKREDEEKGEEWKGNMEGGEKRGGKKEERGRAHLNTSRPLHQLVYPPHHSVLRESHHLVQEVLFLSFQKLPEGKEGGRETG